MHFPIAWKLIVMISVILLMATVPIAYQTSQRFIQESQKREEDANRAQADARAGQVEVILKKLSEKLSIIGTLRLRESAQATTATADESFARKTFLQERDLVSVTIYEKKNNAFVVIDELINPEYLEGYKLDDSYLARLEKKKPFPLAKVATGRIIVENRSLIQGAPMLSIGVPLVKDKLGQVTHLGVGNLNFFAIQKAFAARSERTIFLVTPLGEVLAHPDEKIALNGTSFKTLPIVEKALNSQLKQGQLRYQDKAQKKEYFIGAFSRLAFDLAVVSTAPESLILEPAKRVQREVIYITGVALFAAFFVIFLFSSTLTRPIELLVGFTREIAKGNFKISASRIITSKDEVGQLAFAFDNMTQGLLERDKVKNMFVKFHGSSITEDILTNQDIAKVGANREVCVFFSDIRGFTAFSESRSAEEVVQMLNEYFSRMVAIINRNHGVVDKFIGDAIMAIWGAPKSTGDDAYFMVKSCLEMRVALDKLNDERIARNEVPIKIGMGVHLGPAISGTIGSEERMEYTVIGDTVNMASRIEASTKAFGVDLLLSEPVAGRIKDRFVLTLGGEAKVQGKSGSLKMFKVAGYIDKNGQQQLIKTHYSDYKAEGVEKVEII